MSGLYDKFDKLVSRKNFSDTNKILSYLKKDYREILSKTYFEKEYDYWWVDFYSESCFYRKRLRAIKSFMYIFKMFYETI